MILFGFLASKDTTMQAFYPFSKQIAESARQNGIWAVLHVILYTSLYYIPWEIFFRGIMIAPFLERSLPAASHIPSSSNLPPLTIGYFMQTIPSTLLHFGHPVPEILASIPFGIFAGYLVWRTQSIIPVLLLHCIAGISLDMFLIFTM